MGCATSSSAASIAPVPSFADLTKKESTRSLQSDNSNSEDPSIQNIDPAMLSFGSASSFNSQNSLRSPNHLHSHTAAEEDASSKPPKALTSKYARVRALGSGVFGVVYLATNRETGSLCSIKVTKALCGDLLVSTQTNESCCTDNPAGDVVSEIPEYELLKRCQGHPCILELHEAFQSSTKVWLVTEYVSGVTWGSSRARTGPLPNEPNTMKFLQRILWDLLRALQYLHDVVRIAHMDIKPENIMLLKEPVENQPTIKLIDFGSAVSCAEGDLTKNSAGTRFFCSPEKLNLSKVGYCPKKADIWALGVTAAVNIFGDENCPFPKAWTKSAHTFSDKLRRLLVVAKSSKGDNTKGSGGGGGVVYNESVQMCFPDRLLNNAEVPQDLMEVLTRMLSPDPDDRPTASTLLSHEFFRDRQQR
eukprot:PhF_6_TR43558/c1_g1_i1/m.66886/K08803/DAPK; death-associated protein kinase